MKKAFILIFACIVLSGCSDTAPVFSNNPERAVGWGFRRTENGPEFTKEQISQMNKYGCIFKEDTTQKNIYLTFDEGYENGYTAIILDTLRDKGVKAAFFVTGPYVKSNPDLIKRMAKEGHTIGNHTVNHPSLPSVDDENIFKKELFELDRLIFGLCNKKTEYLRPPKGEYSEKTLALSQSYGYTNVFWSDAFVDWNNDVTPEQAHSTVMKNLHPGEVLLLHAVSKGNAEALGDIIDSARKEGYTFKSLKQYKMK